MTEPNKETAPVQMPEREVEFQGRMMWVRLPRPEQVLVWKRTLGQLQAADVQGWDGEQVLAALERARKIIDSVVLHEVDKTWIDDQLLEGNLGLIEAAGLIQLTVEAFQSEDNRQARRAAAKPKKATRKKAPR